MRKNILYVSIAIASLLFSGCHSNGTNHLEPHFSYEGSTKPDVWHTLSVDWKTCENGLELKPVVAGSLHQSPVNFVNAIAHTPKFTLTYDKDIEFKMLNNGHAIEFEVKSKDAPTLTIKGKVYTLKQFHFHGLSEHTDNGHHAAMEVHFVNIAEDGAIAVLGVLIKDGGTRGNKEFEKAFSLKIPPKGYLNTNTIELNPADMMPRGKVYSYSGSLTTPPCTEGVMWNVYEARQTLSTKSISKFNTQYTHNYRALTGSY